MKLIILEAPIALPLDIEVLKSYLKVLDDDQDATIEMIAKANISRAEDITNLVLAGITRFELTLDSFVNFKFPKNPLVEVEKVEYLDADGLYKLLDEGKYDANNTITPATMEFYQVPSSTSVRIFFKAGFEEIVNKILLWLNVKVYEDFYNLPKTERSAHIDNYLESLRIIPL